MKLPSSSATNLNKETLRHMISMKDFSRTEIDKMFELMDLLKKAREIISAIFDLMPLEKIMLFHNYSKVKMSE